MKLQQAFKLSTLAIALASTSAVFAATGNVGSIESDSGIWKDVVDPTNPATQDNTTHQFVDLGSKTTTNPLPGTSDRKLITQLFKDGSQHTLQVGQGADAKFYSVDVVDTNKNGVDHKEVKIKGEISAPANIDTLKPILGGLTQYEESKQSTSEDIKVVDSNFLQYGTKEKTSNVTKTSAGNLTDDENGGPILTGDVKEYSVISDPVLGKQSTITVGNIAAETGTVATTTTYGLEIKDSNAGAEIAKTTVTVNGLTTTGSVSANTINLNGKDVANELKLANDKADLANTTATEAKTIANDAKTTATAADNNATEAKATATEAKTTAIAANVTATEAKTTATEAKTLASTADTNATEAKTTAAAADTKATTALNNITTINNNYSALESRVNQLNSRINDVEKTAYRGVAIALAAQQQIPNIGAGQFAVFGGVGHYEGETAGAIGIANVFADGRTSLSAAIGVAGGNEVGGRVGVSYVFGGK